MYTIGDMYSVMRKPCNLDSVAVSVKAEQMPAQDVRTLLHMWHDVCPTMLPIQCFLLLKDGLDPETSDTAPSWGAKVEDKDAETDGKGIEAAYQDSGTAAH